MDDALSHRFEEFQKDSSLLEGELEDALRDAEVRAEKAQGQLRRCSEDLSRERVCLIHSRILLSLFFFSPMSFYYEFLDVHSSLIVEFNLAF